MPYTDIWRCKNCNVLPDIQMVGKSFLIACETCEKQKSVEADSLDEVVSKWNDLHEPAKQKKGLLGWFQEWKDTAKGFVQYRCDRFQESRERQERMRRIVSDIREAEEKEDDLQVPMDLLGPAAPDPER